MTNMTTALAADAVWFNSAFHRDSFLHALEALLSRMPTSSLRRPWNASATNPSAPARRCPPAQPAESVARPLRILWAPGGSTTRTPTISSPRSSNSRIDAFHSDQRDRRTVPRGPEVFARAHRHFADHIDRWGYQPTRTDYETALLEADVFVSTASHEFFGLSAVEASLAGAYPSFPGVWRTPRSSGQATTQRMISSTMAPRRTWRPNSPIWPLASRRPARYWDRPKC